MVYQDSFEHVLDAESHLRALDTLTEPGTRALLVLPVADSVSRHVLRRFWPHDVEDHWIFYSTDGLTRLWQRFGWRPVARFYPWKFISLRHRGTASAPEDRRRPAARADAERRRLAELRRTRPGVREIAAPGMTLHTKRRVDYWVGGLLLLLLFPLVRGLGHLLRRDHSLTQRRGCAVIKLVGAGSLFLALPSLQAIRKEFPQGRFFLVGTKSVAGFAQSCDWFDACWTIDDSSLRALIVSSVRVLWNVARHTDHLIDLEVHSRLTTVFGLLSMVRNRIGFVDEIVFWRRGFYTHTTWFNTHGPSYAFYDLLSQWFGIQHVAVSRFHADFRRQVEAAALPAGLNLRGRYVAIGHGCSELAQERQLTPPEWVRVLRPVAMLGCTPVFLGGAADAALAGDVIALLGSGINLCGKLSLMQSANAIAGAISFYGIDSMLLHLARALGTDTTSFWGPTDPATRLRPVAVKERVAFARLPCSPCTHVNEAPPCHGRRYCMVEAVNRLVAGTPSDDPSVTSITGLKIVHDEHTARSVSVSYA